MINKTKAFLATGVAIALIAGAAVSGASAAAPGSDARSLYLLDALDGSRIPSGPVAWNYDVVASQLAAGSQGDSTLPGELIVGSTDATSVQTFISPRGSETDRSTWNAYAPAYFVTGRTDVFLPNLKPDGQYNGNVAGVKASGGDYSVGVAFLKNNGLTLADAGVYFVHISVTAGTGSYTFELPGTTPTTPVGQSEDIDLSAEVGVLVDGALSLEVPTGASATIGSPVVAGGTSTSTGVLGDFTVKDARAATHKGWTLTSVVSDFVAGSVTLPAASLSVKPKIVSTSATGVTVAAEAAAATTGTPFADATDSAQVGDTVLNADLKFVVPSTTAAGTYTSKMTLTLVSK